MHDFLQLRQGGVSLLVATGLPVCPVLHWGTELGEPLPSVSALTPAAPPSGFDEPQWPGLVPLPSQGWCGRPGLRGARLDGTGFSPVLHLSGVTTAPDGAHHLDLASEDGTLAIRVRLRLDDHGVLTVRQSLTNLGRTPYRLDALDTILPLPARATEQLDFTGRWAREGQPQRRRIADGTWVRSGRHGRPGHDQSFLMIAGTAGFGHEHGSVWGLHLAWSGDHERFIDSTPLPWRTIGAGELLAPGEVVLAEGETYDAPAVVAVHSDEGLNGLRRRLHRHLRDRPGHPCGPRPVMLNSWEAVYFEHGYPRLAEIVDQAARIGVECVVLDDGWFLGRRDDQRGLGDWSVDPQVWGADLARLIDRVHEHGMRFGIWAEPEMISPDSNLARQHPDWIQRPDPGRTSPSWRNQQMLDLEAPGALDHVAGQLDALLSEYPIDFVKWDYNRDALEQGHAGRAAGHRRTLGFYRLLDRLRQAHPAVEFESCASGGARIDLEVLARTERVWLSDTNDPLERQRIQRSYGLLLPPELQGSHISAPQAHTTGRRHDVSFRILTALFGHFGIEADITAMGQETEELAEGIQLYQRLRGLLHTGDSVEVEVADPDLRVHGVVSPSRDRAAFAIVALDSLRSEQPEHVRLVGLDAATEYEVALSYPTTGTWYHGRPPAWLDAGPLRVRGDFLQQHGLPMPALLPEHGALLELTALATTTPAR